MNGCAMLVSGRRVTSSRAGPATPEGLERHFREGNSLRCFLSRPVRMSLASEFLPLAEFAAQNSRGGNENL